MSNLIGQPAPDFTLPDTDKAMQTLSSYKGKNVVLLFFPAAFTGTCTKEVCEMSENLAAFNALNAEVFGISVDMPFSLGAFKKETGVQFPFLSDFNKTTIQAYDVVHHDFAAGLKDVAKRASFVIDKDGVVRYAEVLPSPGDYPDMAALKTALAELA